MIGYVQKKHQRTNFAVGMRNTVYLVVARTKDKLGIGVAVHQTLHDLALVDRHGANFEVHLAHEDFDGTLGSDVGLEEVETLPTLEETDGQ